MRAYSSNSTEDYHNSIYREKVTSVVTKGDLMVPEMALEVENGKGNYFDVSEAEDGSVIAYLEDDGSGNETYRVTIGGDGKIIANINSSYLFYKFSGLKEIDLSYMNTTQVKNMYSMFGNCSSLTTLDVSNFDTLNVTNMSGMFWACRSLTTLDVSNFNTSKVTNMSHMFSSCDRFLTNLDVSNFDTSKVTNMSHMFSGCKSLTSLDLGSFNTSSVTNMSSMFSGCDSLTSLNLSSFDTSNVTNMCSMFEDCEQLTSIVVSSLWDTSKASSSVIEDASGILNMFKNCGVDHVTVA